MKLISHYLLNQKWCWWLKDKISYLNFLYHRQVTTFRNNLNAEVSYFHFFWDILKTALVSISITIPFIVLFEIVDVSYLHWEKLEDQKEIYSDIATIFTALISIYFATISIVVSTLYKNFSRRVANLIWYEKFSRFYYKYLTFIIVLSLILEAINITDYKTSYLLYIVTVFLGVMAVIGFLTANIRLFSLFSPIGLLRFSISPNTKKWILRTTSSDKQSNVKVIQAHCRKEVNSDLVALENIITNVFKESSNVDKSAKYSEDEIRELVVELIALLYFYSFKKCAIPQDSLWFKPAIKHKEWFKANSTEVEFGEISLIPEEYLDKNWFEKKLLDMIVIILSYIKNSKNYSLAIPFFNLLQESVNKIAANSSPQSAIFFIEYLRPFHKEFIETVSPDILEQREYLIEDKITLPLATIDNYGAIFVSLILGFRQAIENLSINSVINKIDYIDWLSENDIYNHGFTDEVVSQFKYLKDRIEFEYEVEKKIVTPRWYIHQIIANSILEFLQKIPERTNAILQNEFVNLSTTLIQQNNQISSLQIINRGIQACNKAIFLCNSLYKVQNEIVTLIKVKDIPHAKIDIDKFRSDILLHRKTLVRNFGNLSSTIQTLPKHHSIPDYFGGFYWFLGQECIECLVNDDSELFFNLFPVYFIHTFAVYEHFVKNNLKTNLEYWAIQCSDILLDLFTLSGYALIYKELGYDKIWKVVDKQWRRIISVNQEREKYEDKDKWLKNIIKIASNRSTFFSTSNRSTVRYKWKSIIWRDLVKKGFASSDNYQTFYSIRKRKYQSDLLEVLHSGIGRLNWYYDSYDIFVAFYLLNFLTNKGDIEFDDKVRSILRAISNLQKYEE